MNEKTDKTVSIDSGRKETYQIEDIPNKQTREVAEKVADVLNWRRYRAKSANNQELVNEIDTIEQTVYKTLSGVDE